LNISVLILTRDEEVNIGDCLDSVAWADDIVVLDSGSTDRTVDIARKKGARILHRPFDNFAAQRNFGIDHGEFEHEWILHLDADERVPKAMREEIEREISRTEKDAFHVASKLMFNGRWLKHAGMFPVYQVRLGKRDALRFIQVGHGQREDLSPERLGTLEVPLVHEAFLKGLDSWRKRHERYAREEAAAAVASLRCSHIPLSGLLSRDRVARRRAAKQISWRLPGRPALRFFYMYLLRAGFLDGAAGFHYCRLLVEYERMTDKKIRELKASLPNTESSQDQGGGADQPSAQHVILVNQFYAPDMAPTGRVLHDVAKTMTTRGHSVTVLCSRRSYVGTDVYPAYQELDGVRIVRLWASGFGRQYFIGKLSDYVTFYFALAWKLMTIRPRPDMILALTTPPYIGLLVRVASILRRCGHAHWIMDLYPDVMVSHGIIRSGSLLHRLLKAATRSELRGSAATIALGPDMAERIDHHAYPGSANNSPLTAWVPMWADPVHTPWDDREHSPPRKDWGWPDDELVLLYSGNMGLGHRFNEFLEALTRVSSESRDNSESKPGVRLAFSGGGKRRVEVEEFAAQNPDAPIDIFPYVSRDELNGHFCSADVLLVSLDPTWDGCMVPSKLQGIFAVGKPAILVGSETSSAGQWVIESQGGWVVPPDDVDGLVQAIHEASNRQERARRGRAAYLYGKEHFDATRNCRQISDLLEAGFSNS
jgi:glycosyltransferase involved in cell wall biosynthesis